MNVYSIWPFAQISDDFYYLDISQYARCFIAALFKELALITIREMWGLEQARRQDVAAGGGQKPEGGAKNPKGGPHF